MWGAEDLLASLGGTSSRNDDGGYRAVALHARSTVLLAAGAFGKEAIDSVYVNIPDLDGLAAESATPSPRGFGAKACIHPEPGCRRPERLRSRGIGRRRRQGASGGCRCGR